MAPTDPRMAKLNAFVATSHGKTVPKNLISGAVLPEGFSLLVLGGSEGIGEHIALSYARSSASHIILTARRLDNLERVRDKILQISSEQAALPRTQVDILTCDVSSASSMESLSMQVQTLTSGRLDCVIINAAYAPPVLLKAHLDQPTDVQRAFDVNAMGTFHAAHYFIPLLLASSLGQGAKQFIGIGSMAAQIRRGTIANMGYCVSKMAQARIIEYLAEQYTDQGLWTTVIHPGAVNTSMAKGNTPDSFLQYLTDDMALCGAFCVWASKNQIEGKLEWLNGRFVSATWDVDELMGKETDIGRGDLLKFAMALD